MTEELPLRYVNRTVVQADCGRCKDAYGYTVMEGDAALGEVFQVPVFASHDGNHWGWNWGAKLPDGTSVTGGWSKHRDNPGETFCSRNWAGEQLRRAARRAQTDSETRNR